MKSSRPHFTLQRRYHATLEEVWHLWATADGLESWWGPEGFSTKVVRQDFRAGGELHYEMTATGAGEIAFMKSAGMPLTTAARLTYTEVQPLQRLAYVHTIDFVPGVAPYEVSTLVELREKGGIVEMTISSESLHDAQWTENAQKGFESQLGKVDRILRPA